MIDFRYHLVSLISVFLALAVGIILGAGPLQGAIGDQLIDQVEVLRTERNLLREELSTSRNDVEEQLRFLQSAGPQLVAGSLDGKRVAIVDLDDVAGDVQQGVVDQLEAAGATVVANAVLTESWTALDEAAFRETTASGLSAELDDLPDDAAPDRILATALTVALTEGAQGGDDRSERAIGLEDLLVRYSLVELEGEQAEPADVVLLLSGARATTPPATEDQATPTPAEDEVRILSTLAATAQDLTGASVLAGPTAADGDLVSAVRADDGLAGRVSTVSGVEKPTGRIVVPLAIAASLSGQVGQYGFEDGATVLPPAVDETARTGDGSGGDEESGTGGGR